MWKLLLDEAVSIGGVNFFGGTQEVYNQFLWNLFQVGDSFLRPCELFDVRA